MSTETKSKDFVQTFGRRKNSVAVALCRAGNGVIRVNGVPIDLVNPPNWISLKTHMRQII